MREICASGSVGGEGGNALAYPAIAALIPALQLKHPPNWAPLNQGHPKHHRLSYRPELCLPKVRSRKRVN